MTQLSYSRASRCLAVLAIGIILSACGEHASKGAGAGATTGAVSGAVGGLVSALVFGGDAGEAMARGAVYGGAAGATAGAMAGAQVDSKIAEQRKAQEQELRAKIGDEAFEGLAALARCEHQESLQHAALAQQSENPNFSLAGLWLEVLTYADRGDVPAARGLLPEVVKTDWDISTEAQAESTMQDTLMKLKNIREQYNLPRECA